MAASNRKSEEGVTNGRDMGGEKCHTGKVKKYVIMLQETASISQSYIQKRKLNEES